MHDHDFDLESELRQLRPRAVSNATWQTIAKKLAAEPRQPTGSSRVQPVERVIPFRRWIGWGCAAGFLTSVSWTGVHPHIAPRVTETSPILQPVADDNRVVKQVDEGLVTLSDGTPARRFRITSVDTITWKDPHTNTSLQWSVPREDVRVIPIGAY